MTPANLEQLRTLLETNFTADALRCLCYDTDEFRAVYDQSRANTSKPQLINQLLQYAERQSRLDLLDQLANPPKAMDLDALQAQVMAVLGQDTSDPNSSLPATQGQGIGYDKLRRWMRKL